MQFFVGLDVALETTSVCVIDERGIIIKEGKVESHPQNIARFVRHQGRKIEHVGLEAGSYGRKLVTAGIGKAAYRGGA